MSRNTTPMGVGNSSFLLDRLGQDCAPLQFIRELTQNSIEAIKKAGGQGVIEWGFDMATYENSGKKKLCITDNGCGMTAIEMIQHINNISDSGGIQSLVDNFGVGAKIAAATKNPEGLIYLSWTEAFSDGSMVHLWKDCKEGVYGLRRFINNGSYSEFEAISSDAKPEIIDTHGTRVILLGNSIDDETFVAPKFVTARDRWILKYLNTRYFKIPEGITVKCQDGHSIAKRFRSVTGQGPFLASKSIESGSVSLAGAILHWWILPDFIKNPTSLQTEGPSYETRGHVAAIYQDELYELVTGRSARALLQQFGIIFGTNRVVIYIEPDTSNGDVMANTARTHLLKNQEPLPWSAWSEEFRNKIPRPIQKLMEEICSHDINTDNEKSIKERLKPLMHLYKVSRYRVTPTGDLEVDDDHPVSGNNTNAADSKFTGVLSHTKKNTVGGAYHNFLKPGGKKAELVNPNPFPRVTWISTSDGTREPGQLEDRAASYNAATNDLLINADFRVFFDMIETWSKEFAVVPNAIQMSKKAVQMWFEQILVEAVIGIQALKDSKEWDHKQLESALSEEALTMAVMPRYFVNFAVKRDLNTKMGKQPANSDL